MPFALAEKHKSTAYLDNNETTLMPGVAIDALNAWCNRGNPSAGYAREARQMLDAFRQEVAVECGFELNTYAVVFTSGASESNSHIVTSAVRGYAVKTGRLPHVVTSAAEHKSLLACCRRLAKDGLCQLTVLPVGQSGPGLGTVDPDDIGAALRPNTCLVSIMAANHDTGVLSNLRAMAKYTRKARVPFHTDAAQLFGRSAVRPAALGVDAFSVSFHKLGGPPGVGLLVLRRALVDGYDLCPHISGGGLRGGAENLPGIGASYAAFCAAMAGRAEKTARVFFMRNALKSALASRLPCFYVDDHESAPLSSIDGGITPPRQQADRPFSAPARRAVESGAPAVFWVAPADERLVLPNTLLLAVRRPGFCNRAAQAALEARGVIVGLADAEVVAALGVHPDLRPGFLRVSLADSTTGDDIKSFVVNFLAIVSPPAEGHRDPPGDLYSQ